MLVHTLELADKRQLGRAFEALIASENVRDCAIELDALRIRFAAEERDAAAVMPSSPRTAACAPPRASGSTRAWWRRARWGFARRSAEAHFFRSLVPSAK